MATFLVATGNAWYQLNAAEHPLGFIDTQHEMIVRSDANPHRQYVVLWDPDMDAWGVARSYDGTAIHWFSGPMRAINYAQRVIDRYDEFVQGDDHFGDDPFDEADYELFDPVPNAKLDDLVPNTNAQGLFQQDEYAWVNPNAVTHHALRSLPVGTTIPSSDKPYTVWKKDNRGLWQNTTSTMAPRLTSAELAEVLR